jgi:hypothetical protein
MMKFRSIYGALVGLCMVAAVPANAITLDFDSGIATYSGTNNLTGYSQGGLSFAVSLGNNDRRASGANLFNTDGCGTDARCVGNDDRDLLPGPNTAGVGGNLLIRQENGNSGNQWGALDDDATGHGSITFTLLSGPAFRLMSFAAIDDGRFSISAGGSVLGELRPGADNAILSMALLGSPLIQVGESFKVTFRGSGGIDAIGVAPIPVPATLPLLLAGLAGLGVMARRRRQAAA